MIIAVVQKAVDTNGYLDITNRELYRKFTPLTTGTFQPDGTLLGRFRQHVTAYGDRPFYVDHEQVLTWREIDTIHPKSVNVRLPSVPIGKPLGLNQVLIIDHNKRLLPDGIIGELTIIK